jgi:flagellar FliL protein
MNKKVIMIVLIAIVAAVAFWFVNDKLNNQDEGDTAGTSIADMYFYTPGDYFVTNIKDSKSLSKISISFALKGKDQTDFLTETNAVLRACIVDVMRSHTEEELRDHEITGVIAEEIKKAANKALGTDDIVNVYISDFVIQ